MWIGRRDAHFCNLFYSVCKLSAKIVCMKCASADLVHTVLSYSTRFANCLHKLLMDTILAYTPGQIWSVHSMHLVRISMLLAHQFACSVKYAWSVWIVCKKYAFVSTSWTKVCIKCFRCRHCRLCADWMQTLQTWCNKTPVWPVVTRLPFQHHILECFQTRQRCWCR